MIIEPKTKAEWHSLKDVVVCNSSTNLYLGMLSPIESLFIPGTMNIKKSLEEHANLVKAMEDEGVKVHNLKELVINNPKTKNLAKTRWKEILKELYSHPGYQGRDYKTDADSIVDGFTEEEIWIDATLKPQIKKYIKPPFKNVEGMGLPIVQLGAVPCNLHYMRDQQFVTDMGLVMGNMKYAPRSLEPEITKLGFETLGIEPIYSLTTPFEGGDFIPAGNVAFIGVGHRTTMNSAKTVVQNAVGFEEIAIVSQPGQKKTMHLDTYFNIAADGLCVGEKNILDKHTKVAVFVKEGEKYSFDHEVTSLGQYLKENGFVILAITPEERDNYGSNFLTLESYKIIAPNMAEKLPNSGYTRKLQNYGIDPIVLDVNQLTQGDGGIHCLTCVLRRY